jgi:hypothetical protein
VARAAHVHPENHDGRAGAVAALQAVAAFVEAIPPFREADLSLPLRALQAALFELDKGGAPPVMLTPTKVRGGLKRSLDKSALALTAAVAMEAGMRAGDGRAAGRVADLLHARGHRKDKSGKPITATTVRKWRERLNEGPGEFEAFVCDLWRWLLARMDADPSLAARGPEWFVDQMPDRLLETGANFPI